MIYLGKIVNHYNLTLFLGYPIYSFLTFLQSAHLHFLLHWLPFLKQSQYFFKHFEFLQVQPSLKVYSLKVYDFENANGFFVIIS